MKRPAIVAAVVAALFFLTFVSAQARADAPLAIGSERQLFLDDELVESFDRVELLVHSPKRREIVDVWNKPWEGSGCYYFSVLYDPELKLYRMYYIATAEGNVHPWDVNQIHIAYIESKDGVHWVYRPLGLLDWNGSTDNNIVIKKVMSFAPFIDENPNALPEERYKGVTSDGAITGEGRQKLSAWTSPDGLHWTLKNNGEPVYVPDTPNAFDSHNSVFWSKKEGKYVLYYRARDPRGFRSVERATSEDFVHWTRESFIQFREDERPQTDRGEFYTNLILPYYRAPDIYLGFPGRYTDNGETESFKLLPEQEERAIRMRGHKRTGTVTTDTIFISSRDGVNFRPSNDVFLAPGLRTKNNWSYGDNFLGCGVVETAPTEDDEERELSLYAVESSFTGDDTICRRYSLRIDGFCSLHAKTREGSVVLRPITFVGSELSLNIATSAYGRAYVELCDLDGSPYDGFSKDDCDVIYGDSLDRRVSWKGSRDVSALSGKPIVVKFYLCETDVYSFKFE